MRAGLCVSVHYWWLSGTPSFTRHSSLSLSLPPVNVSGERRPVSHSVKDCIQSTVCWSAHWTPHHHITHSALLQLATVPAYVCVREWERESVRLPFFNIDFSCSARLRAEVSSRSLGQSDRATLGWTLLNTTTTTTAHWLKDLQGTMLDSSLPPTGDCCGQMEKKRILYACWLQTMFRVVSRVVGWLKWHQDCQT